MKSILYSLCLVFLACNPVHENNQALKERIHFAEWKNSLENFFQRDTTLDDYQKHLFHEIVRKVSKKKYNSLYLCANSLIKQGISKEYYVLFYESGEVITHNFCYLFANDNDNEAGIAKVSLNENTSSPIETYLIDFSIIKDYKVIPLESYYDSEPFILITENRNGHVETTLGYLDIKLRGLYVLFNK